ncbi:uncharacterized protein EI97DRAFT_430755 [Westerdykella ornata]|uniref:Uncharacterized protein n=1 Tax=Westerdykella ornata TaxID=318751 RepID=A0A6A6JSZ4_WESOR|nr:uncharacterized protein EI97DRAFT_430755 [Westerdykella ornata]KAF2279731.1 hypothetical protein EI97DRAFT_430755 [Westerdykella ornata]
MQEREAKWSKQFTRISEEKDEKERQLADMRRELEVTNETQLAAERKAQEMESDLMQLRREVADATTKLESLSSQNTALSSELSSLKEQLDQKKGEIQAKSRELSTLREERLGLEESNTRLIASIEHYKSQLAKGESILSETQEDCKQRLSKQSNDAAAALEDALNKLATLETEKASLEKAQIASVAQDRVLQKQVAEAEKAKELIESELRSHKQTIELLNTQHTAELASLQQRLEKCTQDLKKSDEKCKHIEDAKRRELEAHKEITAKKMEEKFQEQISAIRRQMLERKAEELTKRRQETLEENHLTTFPRDDGAGHDGSLDREREEMLLSSNPKRKIDRRNRTVTANVPQGGSPGRMHTPLMPRDQERHSPVFLFSPPWNGSTADNSREGIQGEPGAAALPCFQPTSPNLFDMDHKGQSVSMLVPATQEVEQRAISISPQFDPAVDIVPETQLCGQHSHIVNNIRFPCAGYNERSDALVEMPADRQRPFTPEQRRVAEHSRVKESRQGFQKERDGKPLVRDSDVESPSRPKSQANMASRMVPLLSSESGDSRSPVSNSAGRTPGNHSKRATYLVKLPYPPEKGRALLQDSGGLPTPSDSSGQKRKIHERSVDAGNGGNKRPKVSTKPPVSYTASRQSLGTAQLPSNRSSAVSRSPAHPSNVQNGGSRRTKSSRYHLRFSQELE